MNACKRFLPCHRQLDHYRCKISANPSLAFPPPPQAIGDGGQGWGNALLYIFLSPSIRKRLFGEPFNKCLLATEEKLQGLLETETLTTKSVQVSNKAPSEKVSMLVSSEGEDLNSITGGGHPAVGYGVRSYGRDSTTTATTGASNATNLMQSHSHSVTPHNS